MIALAVRLLRSIAIKGVGATMGELVSLAAYIRRADPRLYQDWISLVETPGFHHTATDSKFAVIAFVDDWKPEQIELFRDELTSQEGCLGAQLFALEDGESSTIDNHDLYTMSEFARVVQSSRADLVVLVNVPCILCTNFIESIDPYLATDGDVYICDQDTLSNNIRINPYFKPGFSQELIYDPTYAPALFIRNAQMLRLLESIEWAPTEGAPSCSELLFQNLLQRAESPQHIPKVLVHLRAPAKDWRPIYHIDDQRISESRTIDLTNKYSFYPERYPAADRSTRVTIIIPTRDGLDLLRECVESIVVHHYRFAYEIIVADHQSQNQDTLQWLDEMSEKGSILVVRCDYGFNWPRLNNDAVKTGNGDVYIFLNNDTVVLQPDWLDRLVMIAMQDDVGAVGGLLLYPDATIQHAGVVFGFGGFADHVYMRESLVTRPKEIFVSPLVRRDVSAVTGACLVVRREIFEELNGFEEQLSVAGDVEFCLRARALGYRCIYDPGVRLIHKESKTRSKGLPESDRAYLEGSLTGIIEAGDPYYNANLSLSSVSPMLKLQE